MIRIVMISLLGLATVFMPGQPEIDYSHRRLYRALEKECGMPEPKMTELAVPRSLAAGDPVLGKFFAVEDKNYVNQQLFLYIGRVNSCRAGGCSASIDEEVYGDSEYFDYFILFDPGPAVREVIVYNYQATHGQEVSARGWLRQFKGYDGKEALRVGKEVDAISGATISVYGITLDVVDKTRLLKKILDMDPGKKIAGS